MTNALKLLDELPRHVFLTVNVGPDVIVAPELLAMIDAADAQRVVLELTEHVQVEDYAQMHAAQMHELLVQSGTALTIMAAIPRGRAAL